MDSNQPTAGARTSEGAAALVTIAAPVVAALAKLEGWQLIAALGIAAAVAVVYGGYRTWLKAKGVAVVLLALVLAPGCGHAAQAAGGTFATVAAAERAYARWAVAEVERLTAQARSECQDDACRERVTAPTFDALDKVEIARDAYHAAQRAAARCLQAGGEPVTCTLAVAGEGGRLIDKLSAVGFKVLP